MSLLEELYDDLKAAMGAGDTLTVNTIRLILGPMQDARSAKREKLTQYEEISILIDAANKRIEAVEDYKKSKQEDLLLKEKKALGIILTYLAKHLSEAEIEKIMSPIIKKDGSSS